MTWTDVDAVLFDVNGTLVDIRTDEADPAVYATVAAFLRYLGALVDPVELHRRYDERLRAQLDASPEPYPEFDSDSLWEGLVRELVPGGEAAPNALLPPHVLGRTLATLFRSATLRELAPFPGTHPLLARLRGKVRLGIVTDAQLAHAEPELRATGLADSFEVVVVSAAEGFRKPDPRLFELALTALGVPARRAVYVGNDPARDVRGAREAGMRTVLVPDRWASAPRGPAEEPDIWLEHIEDLAPLLGASAPRMP